jgi:hypothetical protein
MKRVIYRGHTLNQRTIDMLAAAEKRLGYPLHIMQGSYHSGVSASAGTHDGGGAVDVSATSDPNEVVLALRKVGFAAWHRRTWEGPWSEHIHCIAIGDPDLSSGARTQVREYFIGQNGLASHRADTGPRLHPIPVWPVEFKKIDLARVQKAFSAKTDSPKALPGVQRIQHMLNLKMHSNLIEDGVAGPKTRAAYKTWERKLDPNWVKGVPGPKNLALLVAGHYQVV